MIQLDEDEIDNIISANEQLTDYMTCSVCFQLVTDNRECLKCHRVCCATCLNQFHSSKEKRLRKPCPACNTPTLNEFGQNSSKSLSRMSSPGVSAVDEDMEAIENTFLMNISYSTSSLTRLVHNSLLQKMVNEMPCSCPYCHKSGLTHGDIPKHLEICDAMVVPYSQYYSLNKSVDQQRLELNKMDAEIVDYRHENELLTSKIHELEGHIAIVQNELEEKDLLLQATTERMRQLIFTNHQFQATLEKLGKGFNI